jgi:hypothetical protein
MKHGADAMKQCAVCQDPTVLAAYVYDEVGDAERARIEQSLAHCARCRNELAALRDVRRDLGAWTPPEPGSIVQLPEAPPAPRLVWFSNPVWAPLAAAAMLILAFATAVANVEVRYGPEGFVVRTGQAGAAGPGQAAGPVAVSSQSDQVWRTELSAMEERLRREMRAAPAVQPASSRTMGDAEVLRRVRELLGESETRLQQEFALRLTQNARETEQQRRADLIRIAASFDQMSGLTGAELRRNGEALQQMQQYLVRTSAPPRR